MIAPRALGFALLALTLPPAVHAQFPPEIRGHVISGQTGAGVPGAEVSLPDGSRTLTGADGAFALRALGPGASSVQVRQIGYAPLQQAIELANGRIETVTLRLTPRIVALPELAAELDRAAANASVIGREEIERAGAGDLGDVLQREAGAVITRRGGPASPATISLRGSSADQVLILVDGTPVNDPLTGEADLSLINLSAVERVTVLRGAQSARYGPRALGGVIAVETRHATRSQLEIAAGGGSWGTRHGSARVMLGGQGTAQPSVTAGGEWRSFGGRFPVTLPAERGGGAGIRDNADAEVVALDGAASLDAARFGGRVHAGFFDVTRGMPGTVVQPSRTARQSQRRLTAGAEMQWRSAPWLTTLSFAAQRQDGDFSDPSPPFGAAYDHDARVTTLVGTLAAAGRIAGSSAGIGAEARRLSVSSTALAPASHEAIEFLGLWSTLRSPAVEAGAWQIAGGAALRTDVATLEHGAFLSPQLSLTAARHHFSAELRWARAYNPPSLADLFFQEGVQVQPNPALAPERINSEWTAALTIRDLDIGSFRGSFSTAAYIADIDGMIVWSPDFQYVWSPANFDVRRRGAELDARLTSRRLTVIGSAALTDIRYAGPVFEGQVVYRPRWTATLGAEASRFGVDGRLSYRYTGARPTAIGTMLNSLPSMHLLDLSIAREFPVGGARLRLRGTMENALDTRAGMLIDYPFPGRLIRAEMMFLHSLGD